MLLCAHSNETHCSSKLADFFCFRYLKFSVFLELLFSVFGSEELLYLTCGPFNTKSISLILRVPGGIHSAVIL